MNNRMFFWVGILVCSLVQSAEVSEELLPKPVAKIKAPALSESSSLTQSRLIPGRYWSLNDSGHAPELFALDAEGNSLAVLKVEGVKNVDWEALSVDSEGGLWIGDFGNNLNKRKNLMIYRVDEPGEVLLTSLKPTRTLRFVFSDQKEFPPEKLNFDCEAMFVWDQKIYLLTKNRADRDAKFYRIENLESDELQEAVLIDRFHKMGQVTDAALSADGQRLAVLTFSGIWIFDRPEGSDLFLQGAGCHFKFKNWALEQVEGIAWIDEKTLLICNEQKDIFRVPVEGEGWESFNSTAVEPADELR